MTNFGHEQVSSKEILSPLQEEIDSLHERWANKSLSDIYYGMPLSQRVEVGDTSVEAIKLSAMGGRSGDTSIVLSLPYLNGWTPHNYIRARTLQELVFPNSDMVVLPAEPDSVSLTDKDRAMLAEGDGRSIAEKQMKALEALGLGATALTGYSWGATTSVNLANIGSDKLDVVGLNVDEMPTKNGREVKELQKDFMKSGGVLALRAAVRESEIPALSQAMSMPRMTLDLARFGLRSMSSDSKLLARAMTHTAGGRIAEAIGQVGPERSKVGYIEGSRMFDPYSAWITQGHKDARIVEYGGEGFHGHASADNVVLHAAMVNDGLHH